MAVFAHTCNETMLPGNGGQVVAVDIALKLKNFSGLKKSEGKKRRQTNKSEGQTAAVKIPLELNCMYVCMYAE